MPRTRLARDVQPITSQVAERVSPPNRGHREGSLAHPSGRPEP
jgi:hypothetical protein